MNILWPSVRCTLHAGEHTVLLGKKSTVDGEKSTKRKEAIYMYEYYDDIQYACRLYKVANKCQEFTRMAIKTLEQKYNLRWP